LDVPALAELVNTAHPPTLLDARFVLNAPDEGRAAYAAGHLPGAVFADIDRDFTGRPGAGGRHPLPDPEALQEAVRALGIRADKPVVVYEAGGGPPIGSAARVWWTLRWAGHPDVRVLDGGFAAWVAAGQPTTAEPPAVERGDFTVQPGNAKAWTAGDPMVTLVDARIPARFRGEVEPIDPVAGHIPGAVNVPVADTVDETGRLRPTDELRKRFDGISEPVAAYCGSGITAAHTALALTEAGFDPALYVGSWSHWITDASRPIATGEA
jgi:thiosulfate/3-mercaptopyruvate sulfurtransferase